MGQQEFLLTQEFLGQMLGVRRPTVSGTARQLQARAETDTAWLVVAFAASLDDALVACLREVIYWLPAAAGISIPPKAVHAIIPQTIFPAELRTRIAALLGPGS
jgi:hypothetical protein